MSQQLRSPLGRHRRAILDLVTRFRAVRGLTEALCKPLTVEDHVVQSMPDASPAKWHLAHTAWFFETFVLSAVQADYQPMHPAYSFLFNSYYEAVGDRWPRPARGAQSRPTVAEVYHYRHAVDDRMIGLLQGLDEKTLRDICPTVELGLNHEQQHQELLLTDIKHLFSINPLRPVYRTDCPERPHRIAPPLGWKSYPAEVRWLGHDGVGFAFDNERPRHRVFIEAFQSADRLITAGEFLEFLQDGGYRRPEFWLSDGWDACRRNAWHAPLYWEEVGDAWTVETLGGTRPIDVHEPVCHVSFYEADAFARWAGARLLTEAEWETAAADSAIDGNFLETDWLHPAAAAAGDDQFLGDVWEWTASAYAPYPGYRPPQGALGEYNGKFMCNQMVLRGGSCVTPRSHIRLGYRNFFPPEARWQFTGIRLARSPE